MVIANLNKITYKLYFYHFTISYPARLERGFSTTRLISQTNIFSTIADYLNIELDNNTAEDSFGFLDEIIADHKVEQKREIAVHHSASGKLAIRQDDWIF